MNFATQQEVPETGIGDARQMTEAQLRRLGVQSLVYLRSGTVDGEPAIAIHGADGVTVAVVEDIELALELVLENGMNFVPVH